MRNFILYLQEWVILGLLLLVALKLFGHAWDHPYPIIEIRNISLLIHLKKKMLMSSMKKCQKLNHIKAGDMIEPIVFEPKRKIRLSQSTYKVNSYIDFRPYQNSFKKFETYLHRFSRDLQDSRLCWSTSKCT